MEEAAAATGRFLITNAPNSRPAELPDSLVLRSTSRATTFLGNFLNMKPKCRTARMSERLHSKRNGVVRSPHPTNEQARRGLFLLWPSLTRRRQRTYEVQLLCQ